MSDQNDESSQKRKQDSIAMEEFKRPRPHDVEDSEIATKSITDLNSYCLDHIFNYLELIDLVNVAEANSKLKLDCKLPFVRNYRSKKVEMIKYGGWSTDFAYANWFRVDANYISIRNMIACLKLLRHFGHLLTNLSVNFEDTKPAHRAEVERYIYDNCTESLIEIDFGYAELSTFSTIEKPFAKVEKVSFSDCDLGKEICEFNKWFPSMRHLYIDSCNHIADLKCIENPFPNLTHLELHVNRRIQKGFQKSNVLECLRLNSNLQSLTLGNDFDGTFFELASRYLQNLHHLCIHTIHANSFNNVDPRICFANVHDLRFCSLRNEIISKVPFNYDRLESCKLIAGGIQSNDEFFSKHPIKKLSLSTTSTILFEIKGEKLQLARSLINVTEFSAKQTIFSVDEAVAFAKECSMLKLFEFRMSNQTDYEELQSRLIQHSKWNATSVKLSFSDMLNIQLKR